VEFRATAVAMGAEEPTATARQRISSLEGLGCRGMRGYSSALEKDGSC
jgi:hypothetical protein